MALTNPFQSEADDYSFDSEFGARESHHKVSIGGLPIPINGNVGTVNLATLDSRITFGDHTLQSDRFLSVWLQSDWTGGGQVEDLREASHAERFRHATVDTRYPRILAQNLETTDHGIDGGTGLARPIGDYDHDNDGTSSFWVAFDDVLCRWDADAQDFVLEDTLSTEPVQKGVVYDAVLYIPLGVSGYDTWNGTTLTNHTDITPIDFALWDDKLVALEHDGQVSVWDGTSWNSPSQLKLRGEYIPRHLIVWWSADRFPTLFIVTNRDVWSVDFIVPVLYRTGLQFPRHPDHGLGAAAWRDDALYVSVGVGVHQLSIGMTISAMGLDRDDGLPVELRGRIVDMEPEYNGMLALVEGTANLLIEDDEDEDMEMEESMIYDEAMVFPEVSSTARSTLQRFTGIGWHTVWESDGDSGTPTRVMVSEAEDEYNLWWGYGARMYRQCLRRTFHNPRQGSQVGIDRFTQEGYLRTGRFDANLATFTKLASHMEVHVDLESQGDISVFYRTDRTEGWVSMGLITALGANYLSFDPDDDGFMEGLGFTWIEFEYRLRSYQPTQTAIINWVALYFTVIPLQSRSWRLLVPLQFDEAWLGRGAKEVMDHLDSLTTTEEFTTFSHRDKNYRVRIAQTQGEENPGQDLRGNRVVTLVEVNDRVGDGPSIQDF